MLQPIIFTFIFMAGCALVYSIVYPALFKSKFKPMHMALLVNSALNIKNNNMENPKGENLCNCGPETFLHGKTGTAECRPHTNEIKNLTPVKAVRDDSAHWYVIPADRLEEFRHLSGVGSNEAFTDSEKDELERMFDEKFSQYRTNGDLNNKQLYAEL